MQTPPVPSDEKRRLQALNELGILDSDREERFDRIVRLAAAYFRVPIALVSLVDEQRQWFKAAHGLPVRQTARDVSFCGHAIGSERALIVADANADERFCDNPLVTGDPGIRFYAGQPIATPDGHRIGTMCIIDRQPRTLTPEEQSALLDFGRLVENEIQQAQAHQALERLRQNDADKAAILQIALDCIVTIDSAGRILEFNPAAERTFGYGRAAVLGKEMASVIVPPSMRELHRRGMRHYLATGQGPVLGKRIEVQAMRADGSEFPAELAITPTQIGGEVAFTAFMRDITGPRQARQRLDAQHRIALTLAEETNPAAALPRIVQTVCETLGWSFGEVWEVDEKSGLLSMGHWWHSPAIQLEHFITTSRTMQFSPGVGLPGRVWSAGEPVWVRDVTQDSNFPRAAAAAAAGLRAAIGIPIQWGRRTLGVLSFYSSSLREPERDLLDLLGTIGQQIGQYVVRRRAEARVQELTTELDAIFSLSPDGFFAFDRYGIQSYVNPALLRMLGLERRAVEGIDEAALDQILRERCELAGAYANLASAPGSSAVLQLARPKPTTLTRTVRALQTPSGEVLGKVIYFRDITHEAEVDRMKSDFLSAAAHELRTPMASIYGFSELLLKRDYDEPTRRELTETIHRQSKHLINLVTELLDLARIEARQGKDFRICAQQLRPIVRETIAGFIMPNDKRKVTVRMPRRVPAVLVDAEKFKQALINVLSNAYKYSPSGGPIELSVRTRQDGMQSLAGIAVRDYGIGMTSEQVERVFERFYRADSASAIPGTGLGMSLVKEIVDVHRGKIDIASTVGQGTEVVLWLPQASTAAS